MNTARSALKIKFAPQFWHSTTPDQYQQIAKLTLRATISPLHKPSRSSLASFGMPASKRPFHSARVHCQNSGQDSAIPHIALHIAASSSGKTTKFRADKSTYDFQPPTPLGLQKPGSIYEKRRQRPDSGEDAYFVAQVGSSVSSPGPDTPQQLSFGVADGVGGWAEQGVNPADFSHGLCSHAAHAAVSWSGSAKESQLHPKDLLSTAYDALLNDKQVRAGGSTACFATVTAKGALKIANLGDSGFLHLRAGVVHAHSNPQTHAFNTPFQMSITPPEIMTQAVIFGGLPLNDAPARADVSIEALLHGDVLVLATDGVWDNLSSQDILNMVSQRMREKGAWEKTESGFVVTDKLDGLVRRPVEAQDKHETLQYSLASEIVGEAKAASLDRKRDGPFAKAVQREYKDNPYERWRGGKVDDITVLVVVGVEARADEAPLKAKL